MKTWEDCLGIATKKVKKKKELADLAPQEMEKQMRNKRTIFVACKA